MPKPLPPIEYLRQCFDYDPDTGNLTWKTRPREHFSTDTGWICFNSRDAGRSPQGVSHGYKDVRITIDGTPNLYKQHRIAWAIFHGEEPDGDIDHINGRRADNRIRNLRVVSRSGNLKNSSLSRRNTSGTCGVSWNKRSQKWEAYINSNGKRYRIGVFQKKEEAICERKKAESKYGFHKGHGKPPVRRSPS